LKPSKIEPTLWELKTLVSLEQGIHSFVTKIQMGRPTRVPFSVEAKAILNLFDKVVSPLLALKQPFHQEYFHWHPLRKL